MCTSGIIKADDDNIFSFIVHERSDVTEDEVIHFLVHLF